MIPPAITGCINCKLLLVKWLHICAFSLLIVLEVTRDPPVSSVTFMRGRRASVPALSHSSQFNTHWCRSGVSEIAWRASDRRRVHRLLYAHISRVSFRTCARQNASVRTPRG